MHADSRRRTLLRTLLLAPVAATLLAGCAAPRRGPDCADGYSGRVSVVQGDPPRGLYGGFRLRLGADQGRFELLSPLGQMLARARWSAHAASLDDGRRVRDFASFETMAQAVLGLALPRVALQDWVRGAPAADLPYRTLPDGGFEQLGWAVQVRREGTAVHLLRAQRIDGAPARISLVFDAPCAGVPAQ